MVVSLGIVIVITVDVIVFTFSQSFSVDLISNAGGHPCTHQGCSQEGSGGLDEPPSLLTVAMN